MEFQHEAVRGNLCVDCIFTFFGNILLSAIPVTYQDDFDVLNKDIWEHSNLQ